MSPPSTSPKPASWSLVVPTGGVALRSDVVGFLSPLLWLSSSLLSVAVVVVVVVVTFPLPLLSFFRVELVPPVGRPTTPRRIWARRRGSRAPFCATTWRRALADDVVVLAPESFETGGVFFTAVDRNTPPDATTPRWWRCGLNDEETSARLPMSGAAITTEREIDGEKGECLAH